MARQDFAQKQFKKSAASSSTSNVATVESSPQKAWLMRTLVTIIALACLIYLLKILITFGPSDNDPISAPETSEHPIEEVQPLARPEVPSHSNAVTSLQSNEVKNIHQTTEAPPLIAPEARFDFYDILPRSEVQGPQGVYHSTPRNPPPQSAQAQTDNQASSTQQTQGRFLLQAGSFRSESDAERLRAQLLLNGLQNAQVLRVETNSGEWFRVRTGPFNNQTELNRARDQLSNLGITPLAIPLN